MNAWNRLAAALLLAGNTSFAATTKETEPPAPPLPPLEALSVEPASLTLEDGRDAQRFLIWGKTKDGGRVDVSAMASVSCSSEGIATSSGYVFPKAAGDAEISIRLGGLEAKLPVKVKTADISNVRFVRDVEPVLSKAGCNAGTCHGSAKGKNGFKLSLRGYDPDYDYQALINDLSGRRFNRVAPDDSLMLQKPLGDVPHEGRQVIKPGSLEHQILRQWIAEGTKYEKAAEGRAVRLEVTPEDVNLNLPGMSQRLIVRAHYPDGTSRDVTREAVLSSSNNDIAKVDDGTVASVRRGEAAVLIRYEGLYATKEITVMGDRGGFAWFDFPAHNYIDEHAAAKWQKMKILPSDLCTDAEFIRRVTLDLTGQPPRVEKVREFLADPAPSREKREKLVDALLDSRDYVEFWANKWADLLQCNSDNLGQKGVWLFREWIRSAVAANKPYDKFVQELLLAKGSSYQNPPANYYRVLRQPDKITEDVSQTFLGTRFNCNKCHDHPFEKWTQNQYYEMGAFFARLAIKPGAVGSQRVPVGENYSVTSEEVVYVNYNASEVQHPKTGNPVAPKTPYGSSKALENDTERQEVFVDWLTAKDNPLFARSMANRVWSYFFGRGIIDPVDDIRASNPPSNAPLLDALTTEFKKDFDLKRLMRTICKSRVYQLSFRKNKWNEDDVVNFSHAQPRRLSAEQLMDAVATATGHRPQFAGLPKGLRSVEVPDGMVTGNDFLALFGRPKRQSACECERSSNLTLSHAMSLINGATIGDAVSAPDNRIKKIVESESDNRKVVEEIYMSCLNRPPSEAEAKAVDFAAGTRLEVAQDLAWALLNSPAFLFNR